MRIFAAAVTVMLATGAFADNNEIFINQLGNSNAVGSADTPATQDGTRNTMQFTQRGHSNGIGLDAGAPNALQGALQEGDRQKMEVTQPGNRNLARRLEQDGGDRNKMFVRQSGNDNLLSLLRQNGDKNDASVSQSGNQNNGSARQVGDNNILNVLQSGHRNDFDILSGDFGVNGRPGKCYSCDVTLTQSGNDNYANVWQQDNNQMATITQSGHGNAAYTMQSAN